MYVDSDPRTRGSCAAPWAWSPRPGGDPWTPEDKRVCNILRIVISKLK